MKKVIYVGVFLDEENRQKLLKRFPPKHPVIYAEHLTLFFKPKPEDMGRFPIGQKVQLPIVAETYNYYAQALLVKGIETDNGVPHITVSTREDVQPKYSQELIRNLGVRGEMFYKSEDLIMTLEGVCDTYPRTTTEGK